MKLFNKKRCYWELSNQELELEAAKFKIGGYGDFQRGTIDRSIIIKQLIEKDNAIYGRISYIAAIVSVIATVANVMLLALNVIMS